MKKSIIATALGFIAVMSLFIAGAEADTAFNQVLWSCSWLLVSFVSGKASTRFIDDLDKEERA